MTDGARPDATQSRHQDERDRAAEAAVEAHSGRELILDEWRALRREVEALPNKP